MLRQRTNRANYFCIPLILALAGIELPTPSRAAFINLTPTNGVNSNDSVPLSDLVSGQVEGIEVGDKLFSGFNYSRIGDMPPASDINVLGFQDPDGNWGLSFHGTFIDLPGGGFSDALIRYIVDIDPDFLAQGYLINDAHIFLGGVGVGANSAFIVDESFLESNETMAVFQSTIGPGGTQLSDSAEFDPPLTRLHVVKDVFALASNSAFLPARATAIDQSFSQIVPEPAVLPTAMIGMFAAVGFLRNRRQR